MENIGQRRRASHSPTYRFRVALGKLGLHWTPPMVNTDNSITNYDAKEKYGEKAEEEYRLALSRQQERIKQFAEVDEGDDKPGSEPWWLKLPVEEKLKAPDADFMYEGLHKALKPADAYCGSYARRERYNWAHKGNGYKRIRVPSMKRNNAEWAKFYNEFPRIAAEVRLGNRRFINGAKLKYIW